MIDKNQAFLLELIKNTLFRIPLNVPEDIDWDAIYEESVNQTVVSLIAGSVPNEHSARFRETLFFCRAQYMKTLFEQNMLVNLLTENHIPVIIIKGFSVAKYYPVPVNRVMGDIDIFVPENEYEHARELLSANGYIFDHEDDMRHTTYYKNGICVELHFRCSEDCPELDIYLNNSFSDIGWIEVSGFKFPALSEPVSGLLILEHIRHHILGSGLGLRHIIDWGMFVHAHSDVEFWTGTFLPMAKVCGLTDFAMIITRLCKEYLGFSDDISWCADVDKERLEYILGYVFESGNFGVKTWTGENPAERVTLMLKKAIKNKTLFKTLQQNGLENWKACQRHAFLRPFAFIYQILRYLIKGIEAAFSRGVAKDLGNANKRFTLYEAFELDNSNK